MPVHKILLNETEPETGRKFMEVCLTSDNCLRLFYDTLPKSSKDKQQTIQDTFQAFFDTRISRANLLTDDSDKTTDPNTKRLFWDGTDLVGRSKQVTKVVWENSRKEVSEFRIERVKD